MSIDRDTFANTSEDELADLSIPDQVPGLLAANEDRTFESRETASRIGVGEGYFQLHGARRRVLIAR